MKSENLARFVILLLLIGVISIPIQNQIQRSSTQPHVVRLQARVAEDGGWSTKTLSAIVGEPLHLILTSEDVVHGFAVGRSTQPTVDIYPGEFSEIDLIFQNPGVYTYYCTRWCGKQHWRMRGKIVVSGTGNDSLPETVPLYVELGIDIDAPHKAPVVPSVQPSAKNGARFAHLLPDYALKRETYRTSSPAVLWLQLRDEPRLIKLSDDELWDVVRWIWDIQTNADELNLGLRLFLEFAAAAHGISGKGDGVMVEGLPPLTMENMGHTPVSPPNFTDPRVLLGASPALLEGKIIRGGMGTGMPSFGDILTPDQISAVTAYLYTFAWNGLPEPKSEFIEIGRGEHGVNIFFKER